jgi:hypothetical protein
MLSHFCTNVYFVHKYLPNENDREYRPFFITSTIFKKLVLQLKPIGYHRVLFDHHYAVFYGI